MAGQLVQLPAEAAGGKRRSAAKAERGAQHDEAGALAGGGAGVVRDDTQIISGSGQRDVRKNEHGVGGVTDVRAVEQPLIIQRRRAGRTGVEDHGVAAENNAAQRRPVDAWRAITDKCDGVLAVGSNGGNIAGIRSDIGNGAIAKTAGHTADVDFGDKSTVVQKKKVIILGIAVAGCGNRNRVGICIGTARAGAPRCSSGIIIRVGGGAIIETIRSCDAVVLQLPAGERGGGDAYEITADKT